MTKTERAKIIKFDWDFISAKDDTEKQYVCLTWAERQILLTMLDYVGWMTRWDSPTGQTIDQDEIDRWRDSIAGELMFGDCLDCESVLECVVTGLGGTGTDLALALKNWIEQNQGEFIPYPPDDNGMIDVAQDDLNTQGCAEDEIYGFAIQLVSTFDDWIEDFFEIVEVATNAIELASAILDSVPILTTVTDLVEYFIDNVRENYSANYDTELETQIACDLFCMMTDPDNATCSLTWQELTEYFCQQLSYELGDVSLEDWASFVIEGFWDGDEFVYIMMATLTAVLSIGGDWTGITLAFIQRQIAAFFNDPDSDWETLCTDCVWEYIIDFPIDGQGDWVLGTDFNAEYQGTFVSGVGWQTTAQDNAEGPGHDWSRAICVQHPLSVKTRINYVKAEYDITNSGHWDGSGNTQYVRSYNGNGTYYDTRNAETDNGSGHSLNFTGNFVQENGGAYMKLRFLSGRWWTDSDPGGEVTLTKITVRGRGDNPFE